MSQIPDTTASRRALLGSALGLGGAALALSAPGVASAAGIPTDSSSDFFLTIPNIPGESRDAQYPRAIDVLHLVLRGDLERRRCRDRLQRGQEQAVTLRLRGPGQHGVPEAAPEVCDRQAPALRHPRRPATTASPCGGISR